MSAKLLSDMETLVKDVKGSRENFSKENAALDQVLKKVRDQKKPKPLNALSGIEDLTEAIKSHRLRCELERAFYFHVQHELVKERLGEVGSFEE